LMAVRGTKLLPTNQSCEEYHLLAFSADQRPASLASAPDIRVMNTKSSKIRADILAMGSPYKMTVSRALFGSTVKISLMN
jgi:hypothetical protein